MDHQSNIPPCGGGSGDDSRGNGDGADGRSRKLSVLVADDTPTFQKMIAHLLERRGHAVTTAGDGREAIDHYLNSSFDAIVLDVKMPFVDGLEVAREIRRREEGSKTHTTIIALTTHSLADDQEKCLAAGMDAYLAKPVDAAKLIQLVEYGIQQSHVDVPHKSGSTKVAQGDTTEVDRGSVVDFNAAIGRLGGDWDLFQEFISVFDEDVPGLLRSLREATGEQNGADVERDAHSLRGLISNFGAPDAVRAAEDLEEIGKSGSWNASNTALDRLEAEVLRLNEALDAYRHNSPRTHR